MQIIICYLELNKKATANRSCMSIHVTKSFGQAAGMANDYTTCTTVSHTICTYAGGPQKFRDAEATPSAIEGMADP